MPNRPEQGLRQFLSTESAIACAALNLGSAALFYLATALLHHAATIAPGQAFPFAFTRYLLGAMVFAPAFFRTKRSLFPSSFIVRRSIFNVAAVACFYYSVELGGAARANVLNMTYPVFVALLAGPMLGERPQRSTLLLAAIAVVGAFLHSWSPGGAPPGPADFWGLASGLLAGFAVASLRGAARESGADVILFWMFLLGVLVLAPLAWPNRAVFARAELWPWLACAAAAGVAGQWMLTLSYRSLDASIGSILSTARIPIAVAAGALVLDEPASWGAIAGAGMVLLSNVLLAFRRKRENNGTPLRVQTPGGQSE